MQLPSHNHSSEQLLTLDLGNSHPHFSVFDNYQLKSTQPLQELSNFLDKNLTTKFIMITSIVGDTSQFPALLDQRIKMINFRQNFKNGFFFDMPVQYAETLGDDRLYESYYIYKNFNTLSENQNTPILLIDAGTFLTLDWISPKGLQGGLIFPGIKTLSQCYGQGKQLKSFMDTSLDFEKTLKEKGLPHTSSQAISSAIQLMISSTLSEIIKLFPAQNVILTGGEANLVQSIMMNLNFKTKVMTNLIHFALHELYLNTLSRNDCRGKIK